MQANLEAFEKAVYCRTKENRIAENEHVMQLLMGSLRALRDGGCFEGHPQLTPVLCTRFCAAVVAFFSDPGFILTEEGFNQLCGERNVIDTVFQASIYDGSDFVFGIIPENAEALNKYLLLSSANSKLNLDWKQIFEAHPQETVGLWLSLIALRLQNAANV